MIREKYGQRYLWPYLGREGSYSSIETDPNKYFFMIMESNFSECKVAGSVTTQPPIPEAHGKRPHLANC